MDNNGNIINDKIIGFLHKNINSTSNFLLIEFKNT